MGKTIVLDDYAGMGTFLLPKKGLRIPVYGPLQSVCLNLLFPFCLTAAFFKFLR
jgi:hypothetical protein